VKNLLDSMIVLDLDGEFDARRPAQDAGVKPHGLPSGGGRGVGVGVAGRSGPLGRGGSAYYMEKALELTKGNREEAAKMLGISERTLYRKIQEWKAEAGGKGVE